MEEGEEGDVWGKGGNIMFYVDRDRCNGCGDCVDVCPQEAMNIRNGKAVIENALCAECGMCFSVCTVEAIREKVVSVVGMDGRVDTKWERREVSAMPARGWSSGGSPMWGGYGISRGLGRGSGIGRGQFGRGQGFGRGRGYGRGQSGRGFDMGRGFGRRW